MQYFIGFFYCVHKKLYNKIIEFNCHTFRCKTTNEEITPMLLSLSKQKSLTSSRGV